MPEPQNETKLEVIQENKADTPQIECVPLFIARPDFSTINKENEYDKDELTSASAMVGDAIASRFPKSKTIDAEEIKYMGKCKAQAIVAKIEKYYREPSDMGQYIGAITVSLSFYYNTTDSKPVRKEEYSAKGKRHWGHTEPLKNSLKVVCEKIRNSNRD